MGTPGGSVWEEGNGRKERFSTSQPGTEKAAADSRFQVA